MMFLRPLLLFLLAGCPLTLLSQVRVAGSVVDADSEEPLAYVNIGIREKNTGTVSGENGAFSLEIPGAYTGDTLTFSLVGYKELSIPIQNIRQGVIRLHRKTIALKEVEILADKMVEKKYGIKKRSLLIHFTDGMFENGDMFEIGQLIKLGDLPARITSANLYINASREDSASFRVNFYRYDNGRPGQRIIERSILQRHPVKAGWLRFDLTNYNIRLKGSFIVSIESMPEPQKGIPPVSYEVKLGGTSKSFYRRNSLGSWNTPPHHYCLYVTALVDKRTPDEADDIEPVPAHALPSAIVKDTFSLFVRLPAGYNKNRRRKYPVIYHLDGNAYFDHVSNAVADFHKDVEPIVVGIGYRNAYVMDSLRVRDYTFPAALPADSFPVSGGGEDFYRFIQSELIPYIDKTYRTDTTNRTLMGHSFGGYFTLYALLRDCMTTPSFNNYVAASPSLSYAAYYLMKQFESLSFNRKDAKRPILFLTMGEREVETDFNRFSELLRKGNMIRLESKVYKDLEHMGTAVPTFEEWINRP